MYEQQTKQRILDFIQQIDEVTANKLQYLGADKKKVHNKVLLEIITDLETEGLIYIFTHEMNGKIYRVIKNKKMI